MCLTGILGRFADGQVRFWGSIADIKVEGPHIHTFLVNLHRPVASTILKMLFSSLSLATIFAALPATLAVPNVTAKALPADCSSYPEYNAETGNAGPWILNLANSDNADIEGWGDSSVYTVANSPAGPRMRFGYVSLL